MNFISAGRSLLKLLALAIVLAPGLHAAPADVAIAPPESWVCDSPTPPLTPTPAGDISYGYDYLLLDRQVNVREASAYEHNVYRITSEGSLQSGASMTWSFDPAYETLVLHHLRIIRDGEVRERLTKDLIKVIQQERDLDRHMLNGRLTALAVLDDIRVGDVVDYAYTKRGANPVFAGKFMDSLSTGWSVPVRHQRIRITSPTGSPFFHRSEGTAPFTLTTLENGRDTVRTWEARDLPVITAESDVPNWFSPYPWLQFSEYASWADVAAWAVPLYAIPDPLPPSVAEQALKLTKDAAGPEAKTLALLQFVQQEIRYLGLELGSGTHRPTPPDEVLARRFGDCKDKALLFCTLMRAIGLDAYPALLNTSYRDHIAGWLPSPYAFDHVIACIPRGEGFWWVDPTLTHQQGGPLRRGFPNYQLALIVRPGTQALTTVNQPEGARRHVQIDERFDVTSFDAPARLHVVTRYSGLSADSMRSYLGQTAAAQISKDYVNYYASAYPDVTADGPVTWRDDADTNTVTVEENYTVPNLWKKERNGTFLKAEFYPKAISEYATLPETRVRTMPLRLSHPLDVRLVTHVHLPEDWKVTPADNTVESSAFRAQDRISLDGHRIVSMVYTWETRSDHVPVEKMASHLSALERVRNTLGYNLTYDKSVAAKTPAPAPVVHRFNWLPVVVILLTCAAVGYVARRVLAVPPLTPPPAPGPDETRLVGIGGWLVLVGFGVTLRPLIVTFQFITSFKGVFDLNTWEAVTTPGSTAYQAAFAPIILIETAGNTVIIAGGVLLAVLFYRRKRTFPPAFAILMVSSLVFIGADTWAAGAFLKNTPSDNTKAIAEFTKVALQAAIWVPYMLISRRVKLTFTR